MLKFFFYWSLLTSMFSLNNEVENLKRNRNRNKININPIDIDPIKLVVFVLATIIMFLLLHIMFNYISSVINDIK